MQSQEKTLKRIFYRANKREIIHRVDDQGQSESAQDVQQASQDVPHRPIPQQIPFLQVIPVNPMGGIDMVNVSAAGINLRQAQELNALRIKNGLELDKAYRREMMRMFFRSSQQSVVNAPLDQQSGGVDITPEYNIGELVCDYLTENLVVKVRTRGASRGWQFYAFASEENRHTPISESDLKIDIADFLMDRLGDHLAGKTASEIDRIVAYNVRKVSCLDTSALIPLTSAEVAFQNGVLNFETGDFFPRESGTKRFSRFSLPYTYEPDAPEPCAFDALLADMMGANQTKVQLIFEIIGAILSNRNTFKKIFLFQGVSNAGKTRLANIILRLLGSDDILEANTFSDITSDGFKKHADFIKLANVKEVARASIASKQESCLKAYSDGGDDGTTFKILAATNYPVKSTDGAISMALKNRLLVVPFDKPMDNATPDVEAFEDLCFELERSGIVNKALAAFAEVVHRGGKFVMEYPLNEVIETEVEVEKTPAKGAQSKRYSDDDLKSTFEDLFELSDVVNRELDAEGIFKALSARLDLGGSNPNAVCKKLRSLGGLQSERVSDKTCYYAKLKAITDDNFGKDGHILSD